MKIASLISLGLSFIFFLELALGLNLIPQPLIMTLADSTGGKATDILGGFGALFAGFALIFSLVHMRKDKSMFPKILIVSSVILGIASFYMAFKDVI